MVLDCQCGALTIGVARAVSACKGVWAVGIHALACLNVCKQKAAMTAAGGKRHRGVSAVAALAEGYPFTQHATPTAGGGSGTCVWLSRHQ